MKIEYHPSTVDDLNTAIIYYQEQQPGLSQVFKLRSCKPLTE